MRHRIKPGRAIVVGVLLGLALSACGEPTEDPAVDGPGEGGGGAAAEGEPAVDDDTVVIGTAAEITSPNLQRYTNIDPDINSTQPFWDTLVRRGRDGLAEPWLATEWESNDDATEWTVHLRDDVMFHNGEPMTAEDVAFSITNMASEEFGAAISQYWATVEEADVVDDYTVVFRLSEPNSLFMHSATRAPILPKDYYEEVGDAAFTEAPITTGPYKFVEWAPDDRLVLEAFDDWWGGRPEVTNIIIRPIPEESSRTAALRAGEVDMVTTLSLEEIDLVDEDPALDARTVESIERQFVFLDATRPPFDDERVRQAVNYAMNVPELVEELKEGYSTQIPAMTVPLEPGYDPDLEPYPYDPERARELLEEAGYADGVDVGFLVRTGYPKGEEVAEAIAGYLAEVGINAEIQQVDPATYSSMHSDGTVPEMGFSGWGGGGQFFGGHHYDIARRCEGGSPVWGGYYCDPEMDELIDEAIAVFGTDEERAIEAIQEAERRYYDVAGAGFLFVNESAYGAKSRLNWEPHPDGGIYGETFSWD